MAERMSTTTMAAVNLEWHDITCTLAKGKGTRVLLDRVYGRARQGRITALMGPSGAGKTLCLNSVVGHVPRRQGLTLEGVLLVNGARVVDPSSMPAAYVKQEDAFFSGMTTRETLTFHARLRTSGSSAHVHARVHSLLASLGLTKAADTLVGDPAQSSTRGISGGERKRLSIACELVASPPLIVLDEPTTGLDSFQAASVLSRLRALADAGHTVLLTIHQPSAALLQQLDDLLLLADGRPVYAGERAQLAEHLAAAGWPCPGAVPLSEHALDLVSIDYESEQASRERLRGLVSAGRERAAAGTPRPAKQQQSAPFSAPLSTASWAGAHTRAPLGAQLGLLLARAWRQLARNRAALRIKVTQQLTMGLIYGALYSLDLSARGVQDRLGLLSLVAIGGANVGIAGTIRTFPKEKALVDEERAKRLYSVGPYFVSKLLTDVPLSVCLSALFGAVLYPLAGLQPSRAHLTAFLGLVALGGLASSAIGLVIGCIARSTESALALMPPVVVLMVIFNGNSINRESVPLLLRWAPDVSLIRWLFEGMCVNEFVGLRFESDGAEGPPRARRGAAARGMTGERVLGDLSFSDGTVADCATALGALIGCCWLAALCALWANTPRMAHLQEPGTAAGLEPDPRPSGVVRFEFEQSDVKGAKQQ